LTFFSVDAAATLRSVSAVSMNGIEEFLLLFRTQGARGFPRYLRGVAFEIDKCDTPGRERRSTYDAPPIAKIEAPKAFDEQGVASRAIVVCEACCAAGHDHLHFNSHVARRRRRDPSNPARYRHYRPCGHGREPRAQSRA